MPAEPTAQTDPIASTGEASATRRAYDAIRQLIITGAIPPGQKLKIEDLRAVVQSGASPVREALSLLTSDLLVERIDQRGFRTAPVSGQEFDDILRMRCLLERIALEDSLAHAGQDWEDALVLAHHRLSRSGREDAEAFEASHRAFHMALLAGCQSPILLKFCTQLYDLNIRYRYLAGRTLSYGTRDVAREHREIFEAAVARDAETAAARLLKHYRDTGAWLKASFATE